MASPSVAILDTGVGNLFNITRAIEEIGGSPSVTSQPDVLVTADRVIIPGVGSFASTMAAFEATGIADALRDYSAAGRPILGICLGMQLLMSDGHEDGRSLGLGLIPGDAGPLPTRTVDGDPLRIPHIGWSRVFAADGGAVLEWSGSAAEEVDVYFAHSFTVTTTEQSSVAARFRYGGHDLTAVLRQGNLTGVQFHPERSGPVGLRVLAQFVSREPHS